MLCSLTKCLVTSQTPKSKLRDLEEQGRKVHPRRSQENQDRVDDNRFQDERMAIETAISLSLIPAAVRFLGLEQGWEL